MTDPFSVVGRACALPCCVIEGPPSLTAPAPHGSATARHARASITHEWIDPPS
ncbi:MAG: hypothetical protein M9961_10485 [Ilumatobacteraceae bacterium]|nr:hypothetical protein [Ilumatobacteraceae bacterium]